MENKLLVELLQAQTALIADLSERVKNIESGSQKKDEKQEPTKPSDKEIDEVMRLMR